MERMIRKIIAETEDWAVRNGEIKRMVEQAVEIIERNLDEGRIDGVTEDIIYYVTYRVIEQYY